MEQAKDLLTVSDISRRLGLTTNRIYQLMSSGALPSVRVGGAIRVPKDAWEEWLSRKSSEALSAGGRHVKAA